MSDETICLDLDEVRALRELIGMLATMEERGFQPPGAVPGYPTECIVISKQAWRDMVLRPAMGLRRVVTPKLPSASR